ncbi:MAG: dps [Rhizobium sp.]|jgi:starvation-inducible DNA-binding protein|nr:dps [Rhizobium sp.]
MSSNNIVTDIKNNVRNQMIELLNARLADALDLKLAVKQAHWNIKGDNFIGLHELFDAIATRVDDHADTMAERAVQLGGIALGTSQVVSDSTKLKPYPVDLVKSADHVKALSERLSEFAASIRKGIDDADSAGDADTADIFTQVSRAVDKDLWFVAAHKG